MHRRRRLAQALEPLLARPVSSLSDGPCAQASLECAHGTFVIGLLGASPAAPVPGLCPDCCILHLPLFSASAGQVSISALAAAITTAVGSGANLVNLSLAIFDDAISVNAELQAALDRCWATGTLILAAAGNGGRLVAGQLLSHPAVLPVAAVDARGAPIGSSNAAPSIGRRGVSALGEGVRGYAVDGTIVARSGTSVATAVATGTLAAFWARRRDLTPLQLRAVIQRLGPRLGLFPPRLDSAALERAAAGLARSPIRPRDMRGPYLERGARLAMEAMVEPGDASSPTAAPDIPVAQLAHGAGDCGCGCGGKGACSCGGGAEPEPPAFVYALGSVDVQFPDPSLEQELRDVAAQERVRGQETSPGWLFRVLKKPEARYIARQLCYLFTVEGQPVYALKLRDTADLDLLIDTLDPGVEGVDLDLVVGVRGPLTQLVTCGSVAVPFVVVDQIATFTREALVRRIPVPDGEEAESFRETAEAVVSRIIQMADNVGATDAHRAMNYLAVRYAPLFTLVAELEGRGFQLTAVDVGISRLSGARKIVAPIFTFQNRSSGFVEKYFVRVDVTAEFLMIANHLQPYFDR